MCKIMEDMRNEAALNNARETAERLIKKGKMTLEEIAECVPLSAGKHNLWLQLPLHHPEPD